MKTSLLASAAVVGVLALGMSSASAAMIWETSTPNLAIPDNNATGVSDTLNIGSSGAISDLAVEVAVDNHTWVGDLIFTLEGPDNTIITLMDRPGVPASTFGDSSDLSAAFPISFDDGGSIAAESAGAPCTGAQIIGSDCDVGVEYIPDQSLLAAFGGLDINGDWILTVSDNAGGDLGTLASWTIHAEVREVDVPEPGTLALFGVGLAGLAILRRRKRA